MLTHKTAVDNYRPISLTSVVSKLMELLIRDHLVDHMMKNAIFGDAQHGFVPGGSYMTQLLVVIELWTLMLDCGDPLDPSTLYCTKDY